VEDTIRQPEPARQPPANGDDLPETAHVGHHQLHREVEGDVRDPHRHHSVRWRPAKDLNATPGGPGDTCLQGGQNGGVRLRRGQGEAHQLGDGVGETAKQVTNAKVKVVDEEIIPLIIGVLRCSSAEIDEYFIPCVGRHVMSDGGADDS
jgi:hypothetical protein